MHTLLLSSLLILLLLVPAVNAGSYQIANSDIFLSYYQDDLSDALQFGGSTVGHIGFKNSLGEFFGHSLLSYWNLATHLSGTLDAVACSLYFHDVSGTTFWTFVYRLDSTRLLREGAGSGSVSDCGNSWLRYEEGAGGDPQCTDNNWTAGGGDYYATKLDSFQPPTSTGWWTWNAGDDLIAYFQGVIDGDHIIDTVHHGLDAIAGPLLITTASSKGDHAWFHSDDGTNKPKVWFQGEALTVPVVGEYLINGVTSEAGKSVLEHELGYGRRRSDGP